MLIPTHKVVKFYLDKEIKYKDTWILELEALTEKDNKKLRKIKNDSPRLLKKLLDIKEGRANRVYLAYGMHDIDFYKQGDFIGIFYSPYDSIYKDFFITKEELDKIILILQKHKISI